MSGKFIATIYFYLISAASLALIVIGIFNAVNFVINATLYEKYPLRYPQGSCEGYPYKFGGPYPMSVPGMDGKIATPSASEMEKQRKDCLKQENALSKQQKIDDLKNTLTFSLVGTVLFLIHFPLARKQSKG